MKPGSRGGVEREARPASEPQPDQEVEDPLAAGRRLLEDVQLLKEHLLHHIAIQGLILKSQARRVVLWVIGGLVGGLIGLTLLVVGSAQIASGIAGGLAALFPGHPWLGSLLSGVTLVAIFMLALAIAALVARRRSVRETARRHRRWRERVEGVRRGEAQPDHSRNGGNLADRAVHLQ